MGEREIVPTLRKLEDRHAVQIGRVNDPPLRAGDGGVHILGVQVGELDQQLADHPFECQRIVEIIMLAVVTAMLADVQNRLGVGRIETLLLGE
jgi:hypothetical protein